ncbi:MAG TPA: M81 family metallopeptidase [Roseiflexaceae bacterium]|nr:M81 family metallopeptidase [Roseiflexaceae bacterium]
MSTYRIGIGGIAIESSTFSPLHSTLEDFTLLRGDALLSRYPFMPGWQFGDRDGITWLPCLHARAIPGGAVESSAYAQLKRELLEAIQASLPLDGFVLDIHGAMNVLGMDDAEADLAEAIRALVGPTCVISASMDLHGNVTARLVDLVDIFTAYRLSPHEDVLKTREKACSNLISCLDNSIRPLRAWVRIPVILPGERTSTTVEPGRSVYASLQDSDAVPGVLDASLWVGYVWADEPRSSACALVSGTDAGAIRREAERIARRYWDARTNFDFVAPAGSADWCIDQALACDGNAILISDSGDNPTAGGAGDIPSFIERLLARPALAQAQLTAIYASVPDPAAVAACKAAGLGGGVRVSLGGKLDPIHAAPLALQGRVAALFDGDRVGGDIAVLRAGGVNVIITSRRKPYHLISDFANLGLDIAAHKLTVVKIGYLEPELRRAARQAFLALTDGAVNQDIPSLTYERVQRPIFPLDREFVPDLTAQLFEPLR